MGFRAALHHRSFRSLWLAQCTARLGDSILEIALIWLIFEVTGDPILLAITVAVTTLPTAVTSLPAGTIVDLYNRKHILTITSLLRGGLVLLIPLAGPTDWLVPLVLAVAFATGILEAFAAPAKNALIPNLVPHRVLDAANALFQLTQSLSRMLYVAGGLVIALLGTFAAFALSGILIITAAIILLTIPTHLGTPAPGPSTPQPSRSLPRQITTRIRTGLGFVRTHKYLPSVVLLSLLTTLAMAPLAVVLPFYIDTATGGGSIAFGLLYGAIYLGVVIGAVAIGSHDQLTAAYRGPIILAGVFLIGLTLIIVSIFPQRSPTPVRVAFVAFVAFGIAFTLVNTPLQTLVQTVVPDDQRGLVFAVLAAVTLPAIPAGALLAGPLIDHYTPTTVLFAQGFVLVLITLPLAFTPIAHASRALNA